MWFKRGKESDKLTARKAGGSFNDAAPQVLSAAAADAYFKHSKAWKALLGGMMDLGHAEADASSTTRLKARRGGHHSYLELPNDRIELLHGDNVFVLQAQNGGSVFKGKPVSFTRHGAAVESFALTHYSSNPHHHKVQVFDPGGREVTDPQARNQKILHLMAAMAHQRDPQNKWSYFGDLKELAQKTGLAPAVAPFQPVLQTTHGILPTRVMPPVTLRRQQATSP